jgi:hypothetical protein
MSMTTHRFHSVETLARAQDWLGRIGIAADRIEVSSTGLPSMTVQTEFARLPEVEMIINAAELADPDGWPALDQFGDFTMMAVDAGARLDGGEHVHSTPIGWHPVD